MRAKMLLLVIVTIGLCACQDLISDGKVFLPTLFFVYK